MCLDRGVGSDKKQNRIESSLCRLSEENFRVYPSQRGAANLAVTNTTAKSTSAGVIRISGRDEVD
ncbi:MAG: hypothetical protein DMG96_00190 [Acidobacteria bacterium]|nr:MAG: hypothetical protein DMG98_03895 [Acidobacteriota bacterium]PYV80636.1 MAG: hypothetical protein DMG96_00190 [Acidobacteriota bacterium]